MKVAVFLIVFMTMFHFIVQCLPLSSLLSSPYVVQLFYGTTNPDRILRVCIISDLLGKRGWDLSIGEHMAGVLCMCI